MLVQWETELRKTFYKLPHLIVRGHGRMLKNYTAPYIINKLKTKCFFTSQTYFEEGEKNVPYVICNSQIATSITSHTLNSGVVTDTPSIMRAFRAFFQNVYSSKGTYP